jgi:hypothetical protein
MESPKCDHRKKVGHAIRACGYRLRREVSRYEYVVLKGYGQCGPLPEGVKRRASDSAKLANTPLTPSRLDVTSAADVVNRVVARFILRPRPVPPLRDGTGSKGSGRVLFLFRRAPLALPL